MDKERLQKLKVRAERASTLVAEIEQLEAALPVMSSGNDIRYRDFGKAKDRLAEELLIGALDRGIRLLIDEKHKELESLLAAEPTNPCPRFATDSNE